ncbi:hypothetical protein, partial [Bradyrhizobium sp. 159]|uniref:hypothetical protein n=1 Tax=Bradyrhizobium sp. 159 TaxID=2782632 RepID=UPI001FFA8EBD
MMHTLALIFISRAPAPGLTVSWQEGPTHEDQGLLTAERHSRAAQVVTLLAVGMGAGASEKRIKATTGSLRASARNARLFVIPLAIPAQQSGCSPRKRRTFLSAAHRVVARLFLHSEYPDHPALRHVVFNPDV